MYPFERRRRLGLGGMGEVWLGVHQPTGLPVAIKSILSERASDPRFRRAFSREVEAVAALDHPGIVMVFDHGLGDRGPYLVMEYASGGALDQQPGPAGWDELRGLLLSLLDALAHAHARDLLHLDLKPGNVLICGPEDLRPGLKLTDFGLSRGLGDRRASRSGTPQYMPPEQILGAWRKQGPWTDLYALAAMAWELAAGRPPFLGEDPREHHLSSELPPFEGRIAVPRGFEDWLKKGLAKEPVDRFASAAAAAAALEQLGEAVGTATGGGFGRRRSSTTFVLTRLLDELDERTGPLPELRSLPAPERWQRPEDRLVHGMHGAGLGLFGVRTVPFVGRDREREALWRALRGVLDSGRPARFVLRGASGMGASRLLLWLTRRSRELGVADALFVPGELAEALLLKHRLSGLDRASIARALDDEQAEELAAWLSGEPEADPLELALGFLVRCARRHPLVVALDDASPGQRDLAARIEAQAELLDDCPLLLVVRSEDEGPGTELAPLDRAEMELFFRQLIELDPGLLGRLLERSGGSPGYAMELVGDWVERGVLVPGRSGFELAEGARPDPPADRVAVVQARLGPLLARLDEEDTQGLIAGACLGMDVPLELWSRLAPEASPRAWNLLVSAGLARPTPQGWVLGALPREVLAARATDELHRRCAELLSEVPGSELRRGEHLLAAGQLEDAVPLLVQGARALCHQARFAQALAVTDRARGALDELRLSLDDVRRGDVAYARLLVHANTGQVEAMPEARSLAEVARRNGWADLEARCCGVVAHLGYRSGQLDVARRYALRGLAVQDMKPRRAQLLWTLHYTAIRRGDLDEAQDLLEAAYGACSEDDLFERARYLNDRAELARRRGEISSARRLYEQSLEIIRPLGERDALVTQLNLGLALMLEGRIEQASALIDDATERAEQLFVLQHALFGQPMRAWAAAARGDWQRFDRCLGRYERIGAVVQGNDPEIAEILLTCSRLAAEAGWKRRAVRARRLAADTFASLGLHDQAREVEEAGTAPAH
jgi:tetratricopeptide (TPR) repeat protein